MLLKKLASQRQPLSTSQSIGCLTLLSCSADVNKLKASGLTTVLSVQQTTRKALERIKGMSETKVSKIKDAANRLCPSAFKTGSEVSVAREKVPAPVHNYRAQLTSGQVVHISTGSKALDAVLGGGISTQSITCPTSYPRGKAHT